MTATFLKTNGATVCRTCFGDEFRDSRKKTFRLVTKRSWIFAERL